MYKTFLSLFIGLPVFASCTFSNKTSRINYLDVDQYSYSRRYGEGEHFKTELKNAEVDPETGKEGYYNWRHE